MMPFKRRLGCEVLLGSKEGQLISIITVIKSISKEDNSAYLASAEDSLQLWVRRAITRRETIGSVSAVDMRIQSFM
jgi:hypothetical protein